MQLFFAAGKTPSVLVSSIAALWCAQDKEKQTGDPLSADRQATCLFEAAVCSGIGHLDLYLDRILLGNASPYCFPESDDLA